MEKFWSRIRNAWRSRTVLYGLGVAVLGYMQSTREEFHALVKLLPDEFEPLVWPAVGLGVVVLRFITTQPLEQK